MRLYGVTNWDLLLAPLYLILFYIITGIIVRMKYNGTIHSRYLYWGLSLKFIGAIGFVILYQFYYGSGDTFRYFANGNALFDLAFEDRSRFLSYITQSKIPYGTYEDLNGVTDMFRNSNTFMVTRFVALFGFLTGMFYLPITFFFAFLAFIGVWLFYRTLCKLYPNINPKYLAFPVFFIPSYYFWGSSIMQDSLVVGFLGCLIYASYELFINWRWRLMPILILILSTYVLINVKEYVILAFMPALLIWITFSWQKQIKSNKLKLLLRPAAFVAILAGFLILLPALSRLSGNYNVDHVLERAQITSEYIHRVSVRSGGAAYNLQIEYTPIGMIRAFPKAVNVTLFRPYIWEVRNPVMFLSALESFTFLIITLWLLVVLGILGFLRSIYGDPFLFSALIFAIFFSFAVGATTFNFGSLARYKIPMMPFYALILSVSYARLRIKNDQKLTSKVATQPEQNT